MSLKTRGLSMKASATIAAVFLLLIAIGHLLRLVFQVQITANTIVIPMWASVFGCIITAALAIWLWMDREKRQP